MAGPPVKVNREVTNAAMLRTRFIGVSLSCEISSQEERGNKVEGKRDDHKYRRDPEARFDHSI
jgi:hypothetical protein